MLKQSPCRNQRSRGVKVKHAIQICLLISICVWLLYQAIHSYDNYKAYEDRSAEISIKLQPSGRGIIKLGRKDIYGERVEEVKAEDEGRGARDEDMDQEEPEEVEDLIDVEDRENEEGSEKQPLQDKSSHGLLEEEHYDLQSKSLEDDENWTVSKTSTS